MPDVPRTGVIYDLGYRPYDGPRTGAGAIAGSLFLAGFRNAFGLGRSGKSKVLPFLLLGLNLLPAVIVVGVMVIVGLDELPVDYARYASAARRSCSASSWLRRRPSCSPATCATAASRCTSRGRCPRRPTPWPGGPPCSRRPSSSCSLPILSLYVGAVLGELAFCEQTARGRRRPCCWPCCSP